MASEKKTPKEQQTPKLELYYERAAHQPHADDDQAGDDLANFGEF
jgi:hypothetical protein